MSVVDPEFESDIAPLRRILADNHTVAVVGLSRNWHRRSNFAAKYLQDHGYRVIPVNPMYDEVLGETCYASLEEVPDPIDVVDCFRGVDEIPGLTEQAISLGAKVLWTQLEIVHNAAARTARKAGLDVVMDRCMKIEHARLFGGLNYVGVNTKVISSKRPKSVAN